MAKVISWDLDQWKKELNKRFNNAKEYRKTFEPRWIQNASVLYNTNTDNFNSEVNTMYSDINRFIPDMMQSGMSKVGTNYAFKYMSFIHSQMSSNPPAVLIRPTSTDLKDRRAADAADKIARYAYRHFKIQEKVDQWTWKTLARGIGYIKIVWDPEAGDVMDFNEETKDVVTSGDIILTVPPIFDIWLDPAAKSWDTIRYVIERHYLTLEEAQFKFADNYELLKQKSSLGRDLANPDRGQAGNRKEEFIEIYEYYEKGMPINGGAGRHCFFVDGGIIIGKPDKNPHCNASLPYIPLTYIDTEDGIYGKSIVEYISPLQDMCNRNDNQQLDCMEFHGTIRLLVPAGTDIAEDSITNCPMDIIKYEGNKAPTFMPSPQIPPDLPRLRMQHVNEIMEMAGITEASLGVMKRETSGFSQQTAIEQSNQIRKRLFNKYAMGVEELYRQLIGLVKKHWNIARQILVVGKNNAFETAQFSNADIAGGFDLIVEYGMALPLDPNLRREQIMILSPLLEKSGMDSKTILNLLKLNDLETLYDKAKASATRQNEIFDTMIAAASEGDAIYIEPQELEDHINMLKFCDDYVMMEEYRDLPEKIKLLIIKHIKDRQELVAKKMANTQSATPMQPPAPALGGIM